MATVIIVLALWLGGALIVGLVIAAGLRRAGIAREGAPVQTPARVVVPAPRAEPASTAGLNSPVHA